MTRFLLASILVGQAAFLAAAAPTPAVAPPPRAAAEPYAEFQELVFFAAERPVRVRILPRLDGKPVGEVWASVLARLFEACDRNRDAALDEKEVKHLFPASTIASLVTRLNAYAPPASSPSIADVDADGNGRVTFEEVLAYYKAQAGVPLRPTMAVPQNAGLSNVTKQIFALLDADMDGRLTPAELKASERLLATRDADEDECLTMAELVPGMSNPYAMYAGAASVRSVGGAPPVQDVNRSQVVAFPGGQIPGTVTQRIFKTYDRDGDFELTCDEVGFDRDTFSRLDVDGNVKLSADELDEWRRGPADLDVVMAVGAQPRDCWCMVLGESPLPATTVDGRVTIRVGRQALEFQAGSAFTGRAPIKTVSFKQSYGQLFNTALKGKQHLEEADVNLPQFVFLKQHFKAADFDDDGKFTREEFDRYFDLQQSIADVAVGTSHAVQAPNLFQLMDANRDGRLSVRELRSSWDGLKTLAEANDALTTASIQPGVTVRLLRGYDRNYAMYQPQMIAPIYGNRTATAAAPANGPTWFRKMDRNADGDVSRAEFLGTKAEFAAIDADRDGLIDSGEASTFDTKMR